MKYLTLLFTLTLFTITAQPGWAQQDTTNNQQQSMHDREMMQDSTMQGNMMGMCMKMMSNMKSDTTMSDHKGMMGGDMSKMCMKMCMNMMNGDMMDMDMSNMPENKDSQDSAKMKKSEG